MPSIPETWLDKFRVNTTTEDFQNSPTSTQLANGNILVVWSSGPGVSSDPEDATIIGQIFDPMGNPAGGEIRLNTITNFDASSPSITALPSGGFIVAYEAYEQGIFDPTIRLEEYSASGANVSENSLAAAYVAGTQFSTPQVVSSSDTSTLVMWLADEPAGYAVKGRIYNATANTYSSEFALLSGDIDRAGTAVLNNGTYVAAGATLISGDWSIQYRILSAAGVEIRAQAAIDGVEESEPITRPSVAALQGGGFVIAWKQRDDTGSGYGVKFRTYDAAGAQTGTGTFTSATPNEARGDEVSAAGLADGTFVIAFAKEFGTQVEVERFTVAGQSLGTYTVDPGQAYFVNAVSLDDGRFAVTWRDSSNEVAMEIFDTRDNANTAGLYASQQRQIGTAGDDVFTLAAGTDIANGHTGNDAITGNNSPNAIRGDAGNDTLNGSGGHDTLTGGAGNDVLAGGTGNDTYVNPIGDTISELSAGGIDTAQSAGTFSIAALAQVENIRLTGSGHFNAAGNDAANRLLGNSGNNILNGNRGADTMSGGAGNDIYYVDQAGDQTIELASQGTDLVSSSVSRTLSANIENLNLSGAANLQGNGNTLANIINGNSGDNVLRGYEGNDTLNGLGGKDILLGGAGRDTLKPGSDAVQDIVRFQAAPESSGTGRDIVIGMDLNGEDKFDFPALPSGLAITATGVLNAATFNANLAAAVNAALTPNGAVWFDPSGGDQNIAGHSYLVVDTDGNGSYSSGIDYVVQLVNPTGTLTPDDFM